MELKELRKMEKESAVYVIAERLVWDLSHRGLNIDNLSDIVEVAKAIQNNAKARREQEENSRGL